MIEFKDTDIRFIGDEKPYAPTKPPKDQDPMANCSCEESNVPSHENRRTVHYIQGFSNESSPHIGCMILIIGSFIVSACLAIIAFCSIRSCASDEPVKAGYARSDIEPARYERAICPSMTEKEKIPEGQFERLEDHIDSRKYESCFNITAVDSTRSVIILREIEVNGIPIKIYIPINCIPSLQIGRLNLKDNNILLALQAADIRKDNGKIVGACVHKGKVVSEGLSKKGYVALIDGKTSVGMNEYSQLFEEAIQSKGDFFRQYPLVANGCLIENNPKNVAVRRGICQRKNLTFVAETQIPVSFHDFSQALVDLNVSNAVYLVGSQYACGFSRNEKNELHTWGQEKYSPSKNISYLVWEKTR